MLGEAAGEIAAPRIRGYFRFPSKRPASSELMLTKFPCPSRVVSYLSLVRPESLLSSSRTTADVSLKPLVTDPMICRLPSRTYFLLSDIASSFWFIPLVTIL